MNLGIALGGGGAKGFAHIGVLDVLEKEKIKVKFVAGNSIGAVIGALYCLFGSIEKLHSLSRSFIESEEFKTLGLDKFYTEDSNILRRFKKKVFEKYYFGALLFKKSHSQIDATRQLFYNLFSNYTFDDLKIPFVCSALDINSGEEVVFKKGLLAEAIWATCAIPGIFPPLIKEQRVLVDGGVINNIPVDLLKELGAKTVIAVYLGSLPRFDSKPDTGYRITQRSLAFMKYHFDQHILSRADLIINPDVEEFHWADFQAIEELIKRGQETAKRNLRKIKSVCSFWYQLKRFRFQEFLTLQFL
uniref:PNPLA domain-containing protein n=1 Tax=candidate division WOR-3 bacterium TaxID=2052148 RepID=A0A7C4X7T6_UNCW3